MVLPRAALLLALLLAATPPAPAQGVPPPSHLGWAIPSGDPAAALAQLREQGLAGELRAAGGIVAGAHVNATWDAGGLRHWTAAGDLLLPNVALDLSAATGGSGAPGLAVGTAAAGVSLTDTAHAALVATAPGGVAATLPEGATLVRSAADRAVVAIAGRPMLLSGAGLALSGREVHATTLLALRLGPGEVDAALALPLAIAAWVSPGAANSTLWVAPLPRNQDAPGSPPRFALEPHGSGRASARLEVGRLADPALGAVVLRPDGTPVPELSAANLSSFRGLAVNITASHPPVLWVAYDAAETLDVTFRLDTQPARVVRWETLELSARSALLRALADEPVVGRLTYWPQGQPSSAIATQTPQPALQMDFPLLALRPGTTYEYRLGVTDFAGNKALDAVRTFTTPAPPDVPAPVILAVAPPENATVEAPVREVRIAFADPAGAFDPAQHLRLFVDKAEVTEGIAVQGGNITYTPAQPLGPGLHTVGVVLRNSAGGSVEREWRFTAEASTPAASWLWTLGAAAVGLGLRTARRPRAVP